MEADQGKLFIGGISWETTEEKLKNYFKAFGDVVEAVIMKDRATGRARGFGFIVFADPSVADRVVQEKHSIDGRMVEAKKAVPRDEQPNTNRIHIGPGSIARTKKIFVGGLPSTVTEDDFRKYFGQFGTITDVVVMYDHGTQRPRGFGFITYDSEDAVDKALYKAFHELNDKLVEVKRAIPKEQSPAPTRANAYGMITGGGRTNLYGGLYGQSFTSSPVGSYGPRLDPRHGSISGSRGGFSPYRAVGYGSSGQYGATLNVPFNGPLNAGVYRGNEIFDGGFYGGDSSGVIGHGALAGRYESSISVNVHGLPGRSLSSGGASLTGYTTNEGIGSSSYGGAGAWVSAQTNSNPAYAGTSSGYRSRDAYSTGSPGYIGRGTGHASGHGNSLGSFRSGVSGTYYDSSHGDIYVSTGYGDSTWRPTGADSLNPLGLGFGGFGTSLFGLTAAGEPTANASGEFSVAARQSHSGVPV